MNTSNENQVLVVVDHEGTYYAIPADILESHRVLGAQQAAIEQLLGEDVAGYHARVAAPAAAASAASAASASGAQAARPAALKPATPAAQTMLTAFWMHKAF
jgi:hypothetical protein